MEKAQVSHSPHIRSVNRTRRIMLDVIIALCPAFIAANIFFGLRAFLVTAVCISSCVFFEYLTRRIMKRDNTVGDLSAIVTGMLLAFNLPVTIPLWMAMIGSFFAIVIVKQLFGGLGQNFANPAIAARVFLVLSFTDHMTTWVNPGGSYDAIASATPLVKPGDFSLLTLFVGDRPGCIGETCAIALLIGGIYLVIRRVINPVIPVAYIGTVFCLSAALGADPLKQVLMGGLILGAFFMATDYATSPLTTLGKAAFAIGCGLLTVLIRLFGVYPEGVSFAILFMNILVPFIDRAAKSSVFGVKRQISKTIFTAAVIIFAAVVAVLAAFNLLF